MYAKNVSPDLHFSVMACKSAEKNGLHGANLIHSPTSDHTILISRYTLPCTVGK